MTTPPDLDPQPKQRPSGSSRYMEVLRWVCVPPAAWLASYAGYILGGTLGLLATRIALVNPPSDDSPLNRSLRYAIWMIPQGILCIAAAAATAPRWRRTTAVLVAVWWTLCQDFIHGFESPTLWVTALASVLALAGVFYYHRRSRGE